MFDRILCWPGREDPNLRMVDSKSGQFAIDFNAHSEKLRNPTLRESTGWHLIQNDVCAADFRSDGVKRTGSGNPAGVCFWLIRAIDAAVRECAGPG